MSPPDSKSTSNSRLVPEAMLIGLPLTGVPVPQGIFDDFSSATSFVLSAAIRSLPPGCARKFDTVDDMLLPEAVTNLTRRIPGAVATTRSPFQSLVFGPLLSSCFSGSSAPSSAPAGPADNSARPMKLPVTQRLAQARARRPQVPLGMVFPV